MLTVPPVVRPVTRVFVLTSEQYITFANNKCLGLTDLNAAGKEVLDRIEQQADSRHGTSVAGRCVDYRTARFCHSTNFSLVKDFCRLVINVKYIRGWSVLLSLKKMFIVLREFSFFEPSIHGVNKPESDAGRLKKKETYK